jgi:hypothetical protein
MHEGFSMPVTHRIKIAAADRGRYSTIGAIEITATNPMRAAGTALLELGHDPADKLRGIFEGAQISPVTLHALVKPHRAPRTDHRSAAGVRNVD